MTLPLYNDDGSDPVGVIRIRLNIDRLLSSIHNLWDHQPAKSLCRDRSEFYLSSQSVRTVRSP